MGKLIVANWKMNKVRVEAEAFFAELDGLVDNHSKNAYAVCPPATILHYVSEVAPKKMKVGAQNVYYKESGAFTGEISVKMAKDAGASFSLVGHSERRNIFGETNDDVKEKITALQNDGLDVMLCGGEHLEEHDNLKAVLQEQLSVLKDVDIGKVIVAYEPVWAIGTGKVAELQDIVCAHKIIKDYVKNMFGRDVKVLYGGSVKASNAGEILSLDEVDGVLVGGASLDPKQFAHMIYTEC